MSLTVRLASEEDSGGIRQLFSRAFGREMTQVEWRWKYPDNPDGWKAVIATSGPDIVGHFAAWPSSAWIGGAPAKVAALGDVATDPSARLLGKTSTLAALASTLFPELEAEGYVFGYGFPSPRHLEIGRRLGYRDHFSIDEIVFETGTERGGEEAAVSDRAGPGHDRLWEACLPILSPGCLSRDARRVNWRFHARPNRKYRMVSLNDGSAWGCLTIDGGRALVVDFLAAPPASETLPRLHRALAAESARMGAEELAYWRPPGGPYREILVEMGERAGARLQGAGFGFVTAVVFDEAALRTFLSNLHFTASFYDDR